MTDWAEEKAHAVIKEAEFIHDFDCDKLRNPDTDVPCNCWIIGHENVIADALHEAEARGREAARREENEACCRELCQMCWSGDKLVFGTPPGEREEVKTWHHINPNRRDPVAWDACRAYKIREGARRRP